ncbi:MAG: hypothetical protein ACKV2U_20585 [Bryobacteraceae bacterium]
MNVTLSLNPEVEEGLLARARARGVSLNDYLQDLVAREAGLRPAPEPRPSLQKLDASPASGTGQVSAAVDREPTPPLAARKRFDNLSDLLLNSPFAGASLDLERSKDYPRLVDLG